MERWFRARGGGIGAGLGAVDNEGFSHRVFYRVVGWRKAGGQGEGGSDSGTSMAPVMGDGNGEGEALGCGHFRRGRRGGGEATSRCQRWTTLRRVTRRPVRPKAVVGILRLKMMKGNWVGRPNARLGRTID
jgi:hypothetical protein